MVAKMPGSRMNKRLFLILLVFIIFCCFGWMHLLFILSSYDLERRHVPLTQLVSFSSKVEHDHDWYHRVCFNGIQSELSISSLDDFIEKWKETYSHADCSNMYTTFSSIYSVNRRSGQLIIPETFQTKFLKWLGNDEELLKEARLQFITSIYNKYTHEQTLFNPLRGKRPGISDLEDVDEFMDELLKKSEKNCDLCDYKYKTAEDTFGRIESEHCATAANAFKVEGFHSLVIPKIHDVRMLTEEIFLDIMHVSMKWYMKVYETDKQWRYPHMVWDSLPQASASQVHPHAHLLLNPVRHYGKVEHLRLAAITYGRENEGKNYFTDLLKVHNALGLSVTLGNATAMAYLNPTKENDVMILSKTPCEDFFRLVYFTIQTFNNLKMYAWSLAIFFPKLEPWSTPGYDDIPVIARFITAGPPSSNRSPAGAFEFFTVNNVNQDPFVVVKKIKNTIDMKKHPQDHLQDAQAQKQEIQQQILELQQKQQDLEQQVKQQQQMGIAPQQQQQQQQPPLQQQLPQQNPLQFERLGEDFIGVHEDTDAKKQGNSEHKAVVEEIGNKD
ncbi:uncharacterized protein LOC117307446 [Asterias rubens]|uniref:uncharacterized protein LOC117307446 n=1 Tax=Asterias rubens TaxID=7604 RepID=UPI001455D9C5|nr:uncharacterized protein LOC117307446 [Asterias rubens]XP_033648091.1 uncharacterized protein LOC117307446 [Asterias rubens]